MDNQPPTNLLGLPSFALNALSLGALFFLVCLGISALKTPELSFKIANAQLVTSTSADKLKELTTELDSQAALIQQKDQAYQNLVGIYEQSLKGKQGFGRLQNAIESIDALPEVDSLDDIQYEITTTQEMLGEITPE
jgi:cell division protein YceG involved in septum cleavage